MTFQTLEEAQDFFMKGDGWTCNKDNIEDMFDRWLEANDHIIIND